jgi:hypothetical protein
LAFPSGPSCARFLPSPAAARRCAICGLACRIGRLPTGAGRPGVGGGGSPARGGMEPTPTTPTPEGTRDPGQKRDLMSAKTPYGRFRAVASEGPRPETRRPGDRGRGSRPSGGTNAHPGHPPRNGDPIKGFRQSVREGQIPPGAIRPAKRYAMQCPRRHAVLLSGRTRRAARTGAFPYPLAWRPSRGARRRLPLPHLASSDGRYVRFAYSTPGARNPENFRKIPKKWPHGIYGYRPLGRRHCPPYPVVFRVSTENFHI